MKALLFLFTLALSASTFAQTESTSTPEKSTPAVLRVGLTTGYVEGFGTITIVPQDGNKVSVVVDQRNSAASEVYVVPEIVVPQVISDESRADGSTLVKLTKRLFIQIAHPMKGEVETQAIYKGQTPTAPDRLFSLKSFVELEPVELGNHEE